MNRSSPHSWNVRTWFFLPAYLALLALLLPHSIEFQTADASPAAQATPTCPPTGCAQARVYGYQPRRYDMRSTFNDAASNTLGHWSQVKLFPALSNRAGQIIDRVCVSV